MERDNSIQVDESFKVRIAALLDAAPPGPLPAPPDEDYPARVRESFGRQGLMAHLGATVAAVRPGQVAVLMPFSPALTQHDGFFHAGATSAIADSAGGYAAYTLFPADSGVLTVEFKINLLAPARGDALVAIGTVLKPGRTLTVTTLAVHALAGDGTVHCAAGQQTMIRPPARPASG
ncbi:MAG: PaaI family thioesterase [Azospirillaceae bacterium]